jgi:hypothetical protein
MRAVPIVASVVGALLLKQRRAPSSPAAEAPTSSRAPRRPSARRALPSEVAARSTPSRRGAALLAVLSALLSCALCAALAHGHALGRAVLLRLAGANAACAVVAAALCVSGAQRKAAPRDRVARLGDAPRLAALSGEQVGALSAVYSGCAGCTARASQRRARRAWFTTGRGLTRRVAERVARPTAFGRRMLPPPTRWTRR